MPPVEYGKCNGMRVSVYAYAYAYALCAYTRVCTMCKHMYEMKCMHVDTRVCIINLCFPHLLYACTCDTHEFL